MFCIVCLGDTTTFFNSKQNMWKFCLSQVGNTAYGFQGQYLEEEMGTSHWHREEIIGKSDTALNHHSPTHPLTHSPTHSLTHSLTHSPTHPPTHPPTHSPTHSLTHWQIRNYPLLMSTEYHFLIVERWYVQSSQPACRNQYC